MGLFSPPPAPVVVQQKPAPTINDAAIENAADAEARRAKARRGHDDTILTGTARGGYASASRKAVGGQG